MEPTGSRSCPFPNCYGSSYEFQVACESHDMYSPTMLCRISAFTHLLVAFFVWLLCICVHVKKQ